MTINKKRLINNKKLKFYKLGIFFSKQCRSFDLNCKFNGLLKKDSLSAFNTIKKNYSIPIIPLPSDFFSKTRISLNSSKILSLISNSYPTLKPYKYILNQKKKILILVLSNSVKKNKALTLLNSMILTLFPYIWNTQISAFNILSDNSGNFFFFIKDISLFNSKLDETFLGWNNKIYFNIFLKQYFFKNIYENNIFNKIFFSSLGLVCKRGHGGWLPFSFTKAFAMKKYFFKKKIN